ncbi:hypothetical protein VMT65_09160 [Nocardia sp. CDC153]|uniref:hypothetical protein n=1 Tax=Nocardia sp. CDC153 TaxID=3112167 RepID=UPI002DBF1886|nr:hypothetical protein [Nocardia sp. CDC153]MEC3953194.1 hypothetical protein [Nocardia sp. CDC153]
MGLLLTIATLAAVLASCRWVFRSIRRRQQRGELTNAMPRTYGDLILPGYDPAESRAAENYIEQVDIRDRPSERIVEQRLRNRTMEALEILADGEESVRAWGDAEYINRFFDTIDDDSPWRWREWSTFTPAEVTALDKVQRILLDACDATVGLTSEEFIAAGWPARIEPIAAAALELMRERGRFHEDREEDQPSIPE